MGLCYSKGDAPAALSIHIYTEAKAGIDPRFTIRRCTSDGSAVTIYDYSGGVVYEFAMGEASENSVWDYLSHSLERILDGHSVLYVSNNFRARSAARRSQRYQGRRLGRSMTLGST